MRAAEFLIEKFIGNVIHDGVKILINDHAFDRLRERGVSYTAVDPILRKLSSIRNDIDQVSPHDEFWVYSDSFSTALGFRKHEYINDTMVLALNTVISDPPHAQGRNPVFYVS